MHVTIHSIQQSLDEILLMNRYLDDTIFSKAVVFKPCQDLRFLKIDLETKFLHIIECRSPLLLFTKLND